MKELIEQENFYFCTHYKENTPQETIIKIKSILSNLGIDTEETWYNINSKDLYSVRVTIKGLNIGQNGKGMTKELAEASALAELMERLQNNYLLPSYTKQQTQKLYGFEYYPDEKFLDITSYVEQEDPWLKNLRQDKKLLSIDHSSIEKWLIKIGCDDFIKYKRHDLLCLPYESIKEKRTYYLPYLKLLDLNGSNGMCAGNTKEEALIQGISEIFERKVQKMLLSGPKEIPNVPLSFFKPYRELYKILLKINKNRKYKLSIKDASTLVDYPVAVLIIQNREKGTYGIRLGAHPKFYIAVERCLTECMQGKSLNQFSQYSKIDFSNTNLSYQNFFNSYKMGKGSYPPEILLESSIPYTPSENPQGDNNTLCAWAIKKVLNQNLDILIHDVSYLGFPSFHIIIPSLSEMFPSHMTEMRFRIGNTYNYISERWHNNTFTSMQDAETLLSLLDITAPLIGQNTPSILLKHELSLKIFPFSSPILNNTFITIMCCARLNKWEEGLRRLTQLKENLNNITKELDLILTICILYFDAHLHNRNRNFLENILSSFTNISVVNSILKILDGHTKKIPFFPQIECNHINCINECELNSFCSYQKIEKIKLVLKQKMISFF